MNSTLNINGAPLTERYTFAEVSKLLSISPNTVWRWKNIGMKSGKKLQTFKIGGRQYVTKSELERFLSDDVSASPEHAESNTSGESAAEELAKLGI